MLSLLLSRMTRPMLVLVEIFVSVMEKKSSQFVLIELDGAMCLSYFTIHLP